ncbi:hypothetical protein N7468_000264 [Penicillium chermesinum]|uniref:Uncharacterized protein n=1 Tax=Penicillium chermesinum TaxID=63820 RepID=A0A9W9PLM6_9EURO|nr:uncharacterized protein N7468_000264 [Penicillium chermesinum]KAJ5248813.1 hypothetical protein N7468_000264 [Penicillium chermesinum]KAJ6150914.1 hypothetical protein N7470_007508 [Penicillium chermesinum]
MSQYALSGANKPHAPQPATPSFKPRYGRFYVPLVAAIGLGVVGYNYYNQAKSQRETMIYEEEKRLAEYQQLMDAYGRKESLEDMQQAFDAYRSRTH